MNNNISGWHRITPLALFISGSLLAPSAFATEPVLPDTFNAELCMAKTLAQSSQPLNKIEQANRDCQANWFSAPRSLFESLYSEQRLQNVVNRLNQRISNYTGESQQASQIENLAEYIRAAYFVRYGFKGELGDYSNQLDMQLASSIRTFIAHPQAMADGREQAGAMYNMIYMIDSIRQLPSIMGSLVNLLNTLTPDNADSWEHQRILNVLFQTMNGHTGTQAYYDDLKTHPEYFTQLHQFIQNNAWALDTPSAFLVTNAGREMGRLLASPHASTREQVLVILKDLLHRYPLGGQSDKMWVGIVEMLNYYAPDKAKTLGLDNAKAELEQQIITLNYTCEGPAIIRAQKMTQAQAQASCDILKTKEAHFHKVAKTGYRPVNDDLNDTVEVAVFDSKDDYVTYSSFLFGNSTNNGGQYLEGTPNKADNQARFVAYRRDNDQGFAVWNLEHEYTHYLDGRFNLHGGFNENLREGYVIWWLEGFAEYMTYKNSYSTAITMGREKAYRLSDVLATTYDHDTDRIYRWGYLAVRFLMDNHPDDIDTLLTLSRQGDYKTWAKTVKNIGNQYDNAFTTWLETVTDETLPNNGGTGNPNKPSQPSEGITALNTNSTITLSSVKYGEQLYYLDVPTDATAVSVSISGDGDADLYASFNKAAHYYDFDISHFQRGSEESIRFTPEGTDTPLKAGRYYFSVAAREAFDHVNLTVEMENSVTPPNPGRPSDDLTPIVLEKNQATEISINNQRYLTFYVPKENQTVRIWMNSKTSVTSANNGNINLYAAEDFWPTTTQNEASSTNSDSNEFIEFTVEKAGYVYFLMTASQPDNLTEVYVTLK